MSILRHIRLSWVESGPVGVCVIGLQLDFPLHSSLVPDNLVDIRPSYDSTVGLVDVSWPYDRGLLNTESFTLK